MTEKDRIREQELEKKYGEAVAKAELAESEMKGAQNRFEFEMKEAKGTWGNDIAPGNTYENRDQLYEELKDRKSAYYEAKWEEANAKKELDTFKSFEWEQKLEEDYSMEM